MSPNKVCFQDLHECQGGMVFLSNNKACKVSGIGSICVKMFDGCIRTLQEVRYVFELKQNLLSIGMFDKNECSIKL